MTEVEEETALLSSGNPESSVQYSSDDGDSTGYSTDYSTLEVVRRPNRALSGRATLTLPVRPKVHRVRVQEELASDGEREEGIGSANANVELAQNIRLLPCPDGMNAEEDDNEDGVRDDPDSRPPSVNCSLVPWCAVRNWTVCRGFCCTWISLLAVGAAIAVAVGLFWTLEIFKQRPNISKTMDLTTSGMYNVTSIFPSSNIYGTDLCLNFEQPTSDAIIVGRLAYVTLISEYCKDVSAVTRRNESLYRNSAYQYNSYMFHWHSGTFFSLYARVNGSSTTTIYLLNDRVSDFYCSKHLKPNFIVKQWSLNLTYCNLNTGGYYDCFLNYAVETTNTYYLCINTTIYTQLSYNMTISSVIYNTSSSKLSLHCTQGGACCLPFDGLLSEALHPTCIYVSTQALNPTYIGMELVNVNLNVSQRLSVIFYSLVVLLAILFVLFITVLYYLVILYKVKHTDFNPSGCVIHCSLYDSKSKAF